MGGFSVHKVGVLPDVIKAFRTKSVQNSADVFAGVHAEPDDEQGKINVDEFIGGSLPFIDGESHRLRRKLLNQLVRPDSLDSIREDVVLPSAREVLSRMAVAGEDGVVRVDLVELCERVFLHFAAKLIGLVGVETDEEVARLRQFAFPLFAAASSVFIEDRGAVNELALEAKRQYVEEFYRPSRQAFEALLAEVDDGKRSMHDVPHCLMRYIVTGADPAYLDEDQAIIESIIMFVTSVGTSTQSVVWTVDALCRWFDKHPDQARLSADLPFLVQAFEETLRLKAPFSPYVTRLATEELELSTGRVAPGSELHAQIALANRDVDIFGADAEEFNPLRPTPQGFPRYGVAFGSGAHQCFGLRVVLGNDGTGGAHVRMIRSLFDAGVRPDPERPPQILQRDLARDPIANLTKVIQYPAILTNPGGA